MQRFVRVSLGVALVVFLLNGCSDAIYWWDRTLFETDCRPAVAATNNGHCVPVKKGGANAQAARP